MPAGEQCISASVEAQELRAHCRTLIAGYECPVTADFRDELSYTGTGTLQKNVLREGHWNDRVRPIG